MLARTLVSVTLLALVGNVGALSYDKFRQQTKEAPIFNKDREGEKSILTYVGPAIGPDQGWERKVVKIPEKSMGENFQLHGQTGQDWLVASLLSCKKNGFFIDLAANDAMLLSNTLMLERDFDWGGLCIEANPVYLDGLAKRKCTTIMAAVAAPTDMRVNFTFNPKKAWDGGIVSADTDNTKAIGVTKEYNTVALSKIFEDTGVPKVIDYMSLDVEGAESLVMKGFPWDTHTILILTVERPKDELLQSLKDHGYHYLRRNSNFNDETWVHESLPEFDAIFKVYPNKCETSSPKQSCPEPPHSDTCMTAILKPKFGSTKMWGKRGIVNDWPVRLLK